MASKYDLTIKPTTPEEIEAHHNTLYEQFAEADKGLTRARRAYERTNRNPNATPEQRERANKAYISANVKLSVVRLACRAAGITL